MTSNPEPTMFVSQAAAVAGGRGGAFLSIDAVEHRRRQAAGVGAVTSLSTLDALLNLPLGSPIPRHALGHREVERLRPMRGLVTHGGDGVRRLLAPVATVSLVVVSRARWREGLVAATAFAPFASRVLLLPRAPRRELTAKLCEADLCGVGVWVGTVDEHDVLLPPEPWRRHYWKAAGWCFTERAYAAYLDTTASVGGERR